MKQDNAEMKQDNGHGRWRRWSRPPALLATVAVAALLLVGCGGSGGSETSSAETGSGLASSGEAGQGRAGLQLTDEQQQCLAEQGVELPEAGQGGEGPPSGEAPPSGEMPGQGEGPPSGGEPPQGGPGGAQGEAMKEAFEACGVEMTGPSQGGGAPSTGSTG